MLIAAAQSQQCCGPACHYQKAQQPAASESGIPCISAIKQRWQRVHGSACGGHWTSVRSQSHGCQTTALLAGGSELLGTEACILHRHSAPTVMLLQRNEGAFMQGNHVCYMCSMKVRCPATDQNGNCWTSVIGSDTNQSSFAFSNQIQVHWHHRGSIRHWMTVCGRWLFLSEGGQEGCSNLQRS